MTEREEQILLSVNWKEMYIRATQEKFRLQNEIEILHKNVEDFRTRYYLLKDQIGK